MPLLSFFGIDAKQTDLARGTMISRKECIVIPSCFPVQHFSRLGGFSILSIVLQIYGHQVNANTRSALFSNTTISFDAFSGKT
jgi:hypothetical protein